MMFGWDTVLSAGLKILDKVIVDPQQKAALQLEVMKLQQAGDFKEIEADIEVQRIAAEDRASARARESATGDITPRILAALVIAGYMSVQWYVLTHTIEPSMREIIMRTLGTLDMALGLVLGYYFGSSAGSAKKDGTIQTLSKG